MPLKGENLNSGRDIEKQSNNEMLVYSKRPKARQKENFPPEAPRDSEPMVAPEPDNTIKVSESSDINLSIALKNKLDHVLFILFQSSCPIMLYQQNSATLPFILTNTKISKNIQEALEITKVERGNDGGNASIGKE